MNFINAMKKNAFIDEDKQACLKLISRVVGTHMSFKNELIELLNKHFPREQGEQVTEYTFDQKLDALR